MTDKEKEVFEQETSADELENASGGVASYVPTPKKNIYEGGFPNCAATVEEDSWCGANDACILDEVRYKEMKECYRAWK